MTDDSYGGMVMRTPVTTAAELDALDDADILEGYHDGRAGDPEPGDNRSKGYWHGWRNGRCDGGYEQPDAQMIELIRDIRRARLTGVN